MIASKHGELIYFKIDNCFVISYNETTLFQWTSNLSLFYSSNVDNSSFDNMFMIWIRIHGVTLSFSITLLVAFFF